MTATRNPGVPPLKNRTLQKYGDRIEAVVAIDRAKKIADPTEREKALSWITKKYGHLRGVQEMAARKVG